MSPINPIKEQEETALEEMRAALEQFKKQIHHIDSRVDFEKQLNALKYHQGNTVTLFQEIAQIIVLDATNWQVVSKGDVDLYELEKCIKYAGLGFSCRIAGQALHVTRSPYDQESFMKKSKRLKTEVESYRVKVRSARQKVVKGMRGLKKEGSYAEADIYQSLAQVDRWVEIFVDAINQEFKVKKQDLEKRGGRQRLFGRY